jgi:hypothetical protein
LLLVLVAGPWSRAVAQQAQDPNLPFTSATVNQAIDGTTTPYI